MSSVALEDMMNVSAARQNRHGGSRSPGSGSDSDDREDANCDAPRARIRHLAVQLADRRDDVVRRTEQRALEALHRRQAIIEAAGRTRALMWTTFISVSFSACTFQRQLKLYAARRTFARLIVPLLRLHVVRAKRAARNTRASGLYPAPGLDVLIRDPLLRKLPTSVLHLLMQHHQFFVADHKQVIIHQNDSGRDFFAVVDGRLEVITKEKGHPTVHLAYKNPGDVVGTIGMLSGEPRTATVRAEGETILWRFTQDAFDREKSADIQSAIDFALKMAVQLHEENVARIYEKRFNARSLAKFPTFDNVTLATLSMLRQAMAVTKVYSPGDVIVSSSALQRVNSVIVIVRGSFKVRSSSAAAPPPIPHGPGKASNVTAASSGSAATLGGDAATTAVDSNALSVTLSPPQLFAASMAARHARATSFAEQLSVSVDLPDYAFASRDHTLRQALSVAAANAAAVASAVHAEAIPPHSHQDTMPPPPPRPRRGGSNVAATADAFAFPLSHQQHHVAQVALSAPAIMGMRQVAFNEPWCVDVVATFTVDAFFLPKEAFLHVTMEDAAAVHHIRTNLHALQVRFLTRLEAKDIVGAALSSVLRELPPATLLGLLSSIGQNTQQRGYAAATATRGVHVATFPSSVSQNSQDAASLAISVIAAGLKLPPSMLAISYQTKDLHVYSNTSPQQPQDVSVLPLSPLTSPIAAAAPGGFILPSVASPTMAASGSFTNVASVGFLRPRVPTTAQELTDTNLVSFVVSGAFLDGNVSRRVGTIGGAYVSGGAYAMSSSVLLGSSTVPEASPFAAQLPILWPPWQRCWSTGVSSIRFSEPSLGWVCRWRELAHALRVATGQKLWALIAARVQAAMALAPVAPPSSPTASSPRASSPRTAARLAQQQQLQAADSEEAHRRLIASILARGSVPEAKGGARGGPPTRPCPNGMDPSTPPVPPKGKRGSMAESRLLSKSLLQRLAHNHNHDDEDDGDGDDDHRGDDDSERPRPRGDGTIMAKIIASRAAAAFVGAFQVRRKRRASQVLHFLKELEVEKETEWVPLSERRSGEEWVTREALVAAIASLDSAPCRPRGATGRPQPLVGTAQLPQPLAAALQEGHLAFERRAVPARIAAAGSHCAPPHPPLLPPPSTSRPSLPTQPHSIPVQQHHDARPLTFRQGPCVTSTSVPSLPHLLPLQTVEVAPPMTSAARMMALRFEKQAQALVQRHEQRHSHELPAFSGKPSNGHNAGRR